MVFEKINLKFDIEALQSWFAQVVQPQPISLRSPVVGGWSVQSSDGSLTDGWQLGYVPYNGPQNLNPTWIENHAPNNLQPMQAYDKATIIHCGYIKEVLSKIENLGLNPRRARVIRLLKRSEGKWHQDGSTKDYQVRLHIPIITNNDCFFETKAGKERMAADGSCYLVHINQLHRVINDGDTDRFHLVMNVWDSQGISQFHRYLY